MEVSQICSSFSASSPYARLNARAYFFKMVMAVGDTFQGCFRPYTIFWVYFILYVVLALKLYSNCFMNSIIFINYYICIFVVFNHEIILNITLHVFKHQLRRRLTCFLVILTFNTVIKPILMQQKSLVLFYLLSLKKIKRSSNIALCSILYDLISFLLISSVKQIYFMTII